MRFRIHKIKDAPGENFRWAAHTGGSAVIKPKDYDLAEEIEATTPYAVWKALAAEPQALRPGDVLDILNPDGSSGELLITKYIGFEPAPWYVPESKAEPNAHSVAECASTESR